ncbi:MAG: transcriptional regulator, family [Solimicrobium sp.]|nr:transcriptional regulator, family [Solimicrobium sp.]
MQAQSQFNMRAIQASWKKLGDIVYFHPIASKKEYDPMVSLMNSMLDAMADDEDHPLSD